MMSLLRVLLVSEDADDWAPSRWRDLPFQNFAVFNMHQNNPNRADPICCMMKALNADCETTMRELTEWLDDQTGLSGKRSTYTATLSDMAAGILFHFRHERFGFLCDLLVKKANGTNETGAQKARDLLHLVAKKDPVLLMPRLEQWVILDRTDYDELCSSLMHQIEVRDQSDKFKDRLENLLRQIIGRAKSGSTIASSLKTLGKIPGKTEEAVKQMAALFSEENPHINAWSFSSCLPEHFSLIFEVFRNYVQGKGSLERKKETFFVLSHAHLDETQALQLANFLEECLQKYESFTEDVAEAVERQLYRVDYNTDAYCRLVDRYGQI